MFLVRKGNPKGIKDWDDLAKPGIEVITPNPKTSGGARWNYLAAWGYALDKTMAATRPRRASSSTALFRNVPVLDTGARGSTTTFAQRGIGDVLIAWENEAFLRSQEFGADKFEIVVPVGLDPGRTAGRGRRQQCRQRKAPARSREAYLDFLYTPGGAGDRSAKNFYRPSSPRPPTAPTSRSFPKLDAVHHRRGVRRLGQGAADAFRRRRRCSTRSTGRGAEP